MKRGEDPYISFRRQIDLWWFALGVGVRIGEKTPLPDRSTLVRFNEAGILESDPWRITHLELLALAEQGEDTASDPTKVLSLAHEYAMTGFSVLTQELRSVTDFQLHLVGLIASDHFS